MSLKNKIQDLAPWFHNIHLPNGEQTAEDHFLGDFPAFKWNNIKKALPQSFEGYKVLDIGCNAGFYSIELAKLGAKVVAVDIDEHYLKQAKWVAKEFDLESQIEFRQMQVYDFAKVDEEYDLVWFMGVFYHLRYPLLAMDILSKLTKKHLLFQTFSLPYENNNNEFKIPDNVEFHKREVLNNTAWPKLAFIQNKLAGDPTNWWIANHQGILSILENCGFKVKSMPDEETYFAMRNSAVPDADSSWNASEYLSAIGQDWKEKVDKKTEGKNY